MQEAENALIVGGLCGEGTSSEAYTHSLLGNICKASNRSAQAIDYYMRALDLNPTLWSCYEGICELGADLDPSRVFTDRRAGSTHSAPPNAQARAQSAECADSWLVRRSDSESSSSLLGMSTLAGALGAVVQGDLSPAGRSNRARTCGSESNKIPKLMVRGHEGQGGGEMGTPRRSPRLQAHSPGSVREAWRDNDRDEVEHAPRPAAPGRIRVPHRFSAISRGKCRAVACRVCRVLGSASGEHPSVPDDAMPRMPHVTVPAI